MPIFQNQKRQNQYQKLGNIQQKIGRGNTNPNLITRQTNLQNKLRPQLENKLANGNLKAGQINNVQNRLGMRTGPMPIDDPTKTGGPAPYNGPQMTKDDILGNKNPTTGVGSNQWSDYMKALFPQTGGMDANVDINQIQENPYYKQQQLKGEEAMTRYNAARGLTDSTAEVKQFGDFTNDLLGREFESKRNYQQQEADRAQQNSGRLFNMLDSDANRKERLGQNQFNNQLTLYQAMAGQSPLEYGFQAANSRADMQSAYGADRAGFAASNYSRPSGGGYQGTMPSGPDYSGIDMAQYINQGQQDQNSGANWFDFGAGMLNAFS